MSMMLSERDGPEGLAPGSFDPFGRWSDPSTRTLLPVRTAPPGESASFVSCDTPGAVCALTKNDTIATRIHATTASATHLTTRRQVGLAGFSPGMIGFGLLPRRFRRASSGFPAIGPKRSRRRLRDR